MKKILLITTIALTASFSQAQNVNIPDTNFKAALLAHSPKIDTNNDSEIQLSEAQAAKYVLVPDKAIKSLVGIEAFTACTNLSCHTNLLDTLDISKNTALKQLICNNNQLKNLDITKNINLTEILIHSNQIKTIDLSKNTNLARLFCSSNGLTTLDVKNNTLLTYLSCASNNLTELDVRHNTALTTLLCNLNSSLPKICISNVNETDIASNPSNWIKDDAAEWSLDCSNTTGIDEQDSITPNKFIIRVMNQLGQEISLEKAIDGVFIYQYNDGSTLKIAK